MAMNLRSDHAAMSEINVTPLVDVMLVLLVIFIVTAPLLNQAVPVTLPKTAAVAPLREPRAVALTINADGVLFLDNRPIAFDGLEAELARLRAGHSEVTLQVRADDAVRYGRVAQVMALAQRAGIDRLALVTVPR